METDHLMAQAVADRVGSTKRQIQMWTDAGVLLCLPETDRKGRGRQRLYEQSELPYAAVATELANMNLPIGKLLAFSQLMRGIIAEAKGKEKKLFQAALAGKIESYLVLYEQRGGYYINGWTDTKEAIEILRESRGTVFVNVQAVLQKAQLGKVASA